MVDQAPPETGRVNIEVAPANQPQPPEVKPNATRAIAEAIGDPAKLNPLARFELLSLIAGATVPDTIRFKIEIIMIQAKTGQIPEKEAKKQLAHLEKLAKESETARKNFSLQSLQVEQMIKKGKTPEVKGLGYDIRKNTIVLQRAELIEQRAKLIIDSGKPDLPADQKTAIQNQIVELEKFIESYDKQIADVENQKKAAIGEEKYKQLGDQVAGQALQIAEAVEENPLTDAQKTKIAKNPLGYLEKKFSEVAADSQRLEAFTKKLVEKNILDENTAKKLGDILTLKDLEGKMAMKERVNFARNTGLGLMAIMGILAYIAAQKERGGGGGMMGGH